MHYASLKKSNRLQRLYAFLAEGKARTTRQINEMAHVCAVNSAVSELRRNGVPIICKYKGKTAQGGSIYSYRMLGAWWDSGRLVGKKKKNSSSY